MRKQDRLHQLFPDGSNGEFGLPNGFGVVIQRGKGAHLWDIEGMQYVDCSLAFSAVLLGHGDGEINAAVAKAASQGENLAVVSTEMLSLAERLVSIIPCAW